MLKSTVGGAVLRSRFTLGAWAWDEEPMPEPWVASTRSSPAQKARPVPVRITARTCGSASAFSRSWLRPASMGPEMVFIRSGRFSVMVATPSAAS